MDGGVFLFLSGFHGMAWDGKADSLIKQRDVIEKAFNLLSTPVTGCVSAKSITSDTCLFLCSNEFSKHRMINVFLALLSFETWSACPFVCFMRGITCATRSWPAPNNGFSSCSGISQVGYGTICFVTCKRGYRVKGTTSSRCGNNGIWFPSSRPKCQRK